MIRPHPAEGPDITNPELHRPELEAHGTDEARRLRIERANAVSWVIRHKGSRLTEAQLQAIEDVLR